MAFKERVLIVVRRIPRGRVMTYRTVAARAGSPRAARAVGTLMRMNVDPEIPCHRVVCADGSVGQYNRGGAVAKIAILRREGVTIQRGKVVHPVVRRG